MKRDIKLIVTDVDGTIAKADNSISDKTKKCFDNLKEHGIKVVLATGRMLSAAKLMAERLNLDTPLIAYQGAVVQNANDAKPLYANYVEKDCVVKIIKYLRERKIHTQFYIDNQLYVEPQNDNDIVKNYAKKMETEYKVIENVEEFDLTTFPKILAINMNHDIIADVQRECREIFKEKMCITLSTPFFCEFTNPLAHKGEALRFLADYYNIPLEQTMGFGDQNNDLTMIQTAGIGVAVGNATQNLKDASDFVTKSLDEDGVVYAIEKFVNLGD